MERTLSRLGLASAPDILQIKRRERDVRDKAVDYGRQEWSQSEFIASAQSRLSRQRSSFARPRAPHCKCSNCVAPSPHCCTGKCRRLLKLHQKAGSRLVAESDPAHIKCLTQLASRLYPTYSPDGCSSMLTGASLLTGGRACRPLHSRAGSAAAQNAPTAKTAR